MSVWVEKNKETDIIYTPDHVHKQICVEPDLYNEPHVLAE